jgi:5-methylcytosine-specific restriction endonuclease McrA
LPPGVKRWADLGGCPGVLVRRAGHLADNIGRMGEVPNRPRPSEACIVGSLEGGAMLPRPCLDCGRLAAPGGSRCQDCARRVQRAKTARRQSAPGDGADRRLRAAVRAVGAATCAMCGRTVPASMVEVDHIRPLASGGTNTLDNLQPLCVPCHRLKTRQERKGGQYGNDTAYR